MGKKEDLKQLEKLLKNVVKYKPKEPPKKPKKQPSKSELEAVYTFKGVAWGKGVDLGALNI